MTLEQLRIFVAAAERQHVRSAAEALHLTQSSVSGAIKTLEGSYGAKLFDRVGRNIVLNAAGRVFLTEANAVLARAAAAEAALADLGDLSRGRLSIHASQTIANYWLPARLAAFHRHYPGVVLEVAIGNTADVAAAIEGGEAELGFVEGEIDRPALSRAVVETDELCLVVAPQHPWAELGRPPDLLQAEWVIRESGSGTREALERMLAGQGRAIEDLRIAMTLPGNEAICAAVEAGVGAAVMSHSVAATALQSGRLRAVPAYIPARRFYLLRHKARYRSKAADAFVSTVAHLEN